MSSLSVAEKNANNGETWCYTSLETISFSHLWTIDNFRYYDEDEVLTSSEFCPKHDETMKWGLIFEHNPQRRQFRLSLKLLSTNNLPVKANYAFHFIDDSGKHFGQHMTGDHKFIKEKDFVFFSFETECFIIDDNLTIKCAIGIQNKFKLRSNESLLKKIKVPEFRLSDNIGTLFNNKKLSDVILSVKDPSTVSKIEFYAHRAILAANSSVFSAMFEHDTKERRLSIIEIEDTDPIVIEEMLRFIYTDRITKMEEMVVDLLAIADKYDLERLKLICQERICCKLLTETACETLVLADIYNAKQLEECALDFISPRLDSVMKTAGWDEMVEKHPHRAISLLKVKLNQIQQV